MTVESALDTTGEAVVALEDAVVAVTDWTGGVVVAGAVVIAACSGAAVVVGADTTLLVGAFTICWVRTIWGCYNGRNTLKKKLDLSYHLLLNLLDLLSLLDNHMLLIVSSCLLYNLLNLNQPCNRSAKAHFKRRTCWRPAGVLNI